MTYVYAEDMLPFELRLRIRMETALIEASESAELFYVDENEFLEDLRSNSLNSKTKSYYNKIREIQLHYYMDMLKKFVSKKKYDKIKGSLKKTFEEITKWERNKFILEKYYQMSLSKEFYRKQIDYGSHLIRKHGTSMSVAHVSSSVIQAIVCGWLLMNNMPILSAIFYWASGTIPTFGYYYFFESLYYKFHAWKAFDNKNKMRQFFQTRKTVHEKLKFSLRSDDLLFIFDDESRKIVLSVHEEGIINKAKKFLGLFKKQAELHELIAFAKKNNLINQNIENILSENKFDEQIKKGLIIFEILKHEHANGHFLLASEFSDNFVVIKNFKDAQFLVEWATKVLQDSKNLDDVLQLFLMLPDQTNPIELAHVLNKVIVPEFVHRPDLFNYVHYQRLKFNTKLLALKLYNTKSFRMDENVKEILKHYLIKNFTKYKKIDFSNENVECVNTLEEILQFVSK